MTTITCTAYNGGLVATHDLRTCLSRIAVKEHACMRCEQAVKFMMENKDEIADLKAKYAKRLKAKGVLGTDSNGNHVMGVSGTDKPENIYPEVFEPQLERIKDFLEKIKANRIERTDDPVTMPPLCPRCKLRPQHPRQKYGHTVLSGACLECLRNTRREAEQQRRANREWKITLDFSEEQEFLQSLRAHARANRRTLEGEIMFRLEQGGEG